MNPIAAFLEQQGYLVLDGGLATELEGRGYDLRDALWSARLLVEEPAAIRQVHGDYLAAGADCLITASYQATIPGFRQRGMAEGEAIRLLRLAVALAVEARDGYWKDKSQIPNPKSQEENRKSQEENRKSQEENPKSQIPNPKIRNPKSEIQNSKSGRLRPLVAASVGPYGAYLADGSEYRGDYGLDEAALVVFHEQRWGILAASAADLLACETIPSFVEARALAKLLAATPGRYAWFSFSCRDGAHISDGTPLAECAAFLAGFEQVAAVGINCTAPRYLPGLIAEVRRVTDKPIVVYPNSGERYDGVAQGWVGLSEPADFGSDSRRWAAAGARLIGGCCRTGPAHIRQIRAALEGEKMNTETPRTRRRRGRFCNG
jgi:homocysteine S-methyltransferase